MPGAVVTMSGGMDSTLCLALALKDGFEVAALHLNYGHRTEARELKAFDNICNYYNIEKRLIVDINHLKLIGGSSLTDSSIPVSDANLDSKEIPTSYVPFRNGNILAIASSWAEVLNFGSVFIGAMESDSSGYPDCREDFFKAFNFAINLGIKPGLKIHIHTPLMNLNKTDIVRIGHELGIPFDMTWSCYQNSDIACGSCDSCALRLRGFQKAGIDDPIPYINKPDYIENYKL